MSQEILNRLYVIDVDMILFIFFNLCIIILTIVLLVLLHLIKREEEDEFYSITANLLRNRRNADSDELKKIYDDVIEVRNSKDNKVKFFLIVKRIVICIILTVIVLSFSTWKKISNVDGGQISHLHSVSSVVKDDIKVNAYYVIAYNYIDDVVTLSVFVQNNSDKVLESGVLIEEKTEATIDIEKMEPNEERIISFTTKKTESYNFNLSDIKFAE